MSTSRGGSGYEVGAFKAIVWFSDSLYRMVCVWRGGGPKMSLMGLGVKVTLLDKSVFLWEKKDF